MLFLKIYSHIKLFNKIQTGQIKISRKQLQEKFDCFAEAPLSNKNIVNLSDVPKKFFSMDKNIIKKIIALVDRKKKLASEKKKEESSQKKLVDAIIRQLRCDDSKMTSSQPPPVIV